MKILGLDLSLTSTGIAKYDSDALIRYSTFRLKPPSKLAGHPRLQWLRSNIRTAVSEAQYVIVEGPSYGNQGSERQKGHHERAGLWWIVTHDLWNLGLPVAIAPPAQIKKFATGKGNAGKDEVLSAVVRRYDDFKGGNDEADALVAAALAAQKHGCPIVPVPQSHLTALDGVDWAQCVGDNA